MSALPTTFRPGRRSRLVDRGALVVDDPAPGGRAFNLDHHVGNSTPSEWRRLTTASIARAAVADGLDPAGFGAVTIRHFDTDGALGVWSLFNPSEAMERADLIDSASCAGDFAEIDLASEVGWRAAQVSMTLQEGLTARLGARKPRSKVKDLFDAAFGVLPDLLADPGSFEPYWGPSVRQFSDDLEWLAQRHRPGELAPVVATGGRRHPCLSALCSYFTAPVLTLTGEEGSYRVLLRPRWAWHYDAAFVGPIGIRRLDDLRDQLAGLERAAGGRALWCGHSFGHGTWIVTVTGSRLGPAEVASAVTRQVGSP